MDCSSIVLAKNFDIRHVRLGSLRALDNGGKIVYVNYKGKPLVMQTPKLKAPFGVSNWEGKFSIDLSLNGHDGSNESVTAFFNALSALDEFLLEEGMQNGMAWFKRKLPNKEVVDALYTRNVKFPKDKSTGEITDKYPPTFKLSLPHREGKFQCEAYDVTRNRIELSDIELKGGKVTAIAQCLGIWVAGGKFGCTWKVVQLRCEPQEAINGYAFRDIEGEVDGGAAADADDISDGEEEEAEGSAKSKAKAGSKSGAARTTQVETSDEEGDDAEDGDDDEDDALERVGAKK